MENPSKGVPEPAERKLGTALPAVSTSKDTTSDNTLTKTDSSAPMPVWQKYLREVIALALWLGVFLKLFVFDVDRWLIQAYFPSAMWILDYRFAFFVAIAALTAIFWRLHLLWRWICYLLFYPFIVLVWHVPAFVIKRQSWTLGIALAALCVSAVRYFRINFLLISGITLGTIVCAFSNRPWLLILGASLLGVSLLVMYFRTVTAAFRPTFDIFSIKALNTLWGFIQKNYGTNQIANIPVENMTEQQRSTWTTNLRMIVVYNRACYFLASKLRDLRRSNLNAVVYIVRMIVLFFATAWTFFLFNFSLFKCDPSSYIITKGSTGFDFFYYSFNRLFSNSTGGIEPVSVISQMLAMIGTVFMGLIFAVVVVFVVTSLQKSRDDSHMEETVLAIKEHANSIEPYLDERFGMTIREAVEELQKMSAAFIGVIYYLSPSLRPPDDDPKN